MGAVSEARKSRDCHLAARRAGRVANLSIMLQRPAPAPDLTSLCTSLPTVDGDAEALAEVQALFRRTTD